MTNRDVYHHCSAMLFHEQGTLVCTMCMSIGQGYEVDIKLKNKGEHNLEYQMRRPDGRLAQHSAVVSVIEQQ